MASVGVANEDGFISRSGKEDEEISDFDDGYVVKELELINKDLEVEKKFGFVEKVLKIDESVDIESSLVKEEEVKIPKIVGFEEEVVEKRFNVEEIYNDEVEVDKEDNLVDQIPERDEVSAIELNLEKQEFILERDESIEVAASCEGNQEFDVKLEKDEEKEEVFSEDEDWEGIEKSEVAKVFSFASKFVTCGENNELVSKLGNDVQMQLYGLHKVAMEGPCRQPPPLALKVSARAKWNSWQQLGNMTPEVAMEQYVDLLSNGIPGWMGENLESTSSHEQDRHNVDPEAEGSKTAANDTVSTLHTPSSSNERKPAEFQSVGAGSDVKSL
ncbi:Acyl-coa-binding domain-containing protein [Thalictrum thalictroides]|uniref:Acyl-coa-binding domain-containing protein n=1 Tax=Thalictrum thalictroides TaxID=46969 RepID=A0A7J6WPH6_THATH|nr:Acyl-coa-binding domain-containing protein [Thalictrum thalictroides]